MKRAVLHALVLVVFAAVVAGGAALWQRRPWRPLVSVNGRTLTAEEAERCAEGLFGAAAQGTPRADDRLRRAARAWTIKEVLLQEAVAREVKVSAEEMEVSRAAATNGVRGFSFEESVLVSSFVLHEAVEKAFAARAPLPAGMDDAAAQAAFRRRVGARLGAVFADAFRRASVSSPAYPEFTRPAGVFDGPLADCPFLWLQWTLRPVVSVGGRTLGARELEWRAQTLLDDAKRAEHLLVRPGRMEDALRHYRRQAAQAWIVKEVLLAEARARGMRVTPAAEKEALAATAAALKGRGLTPEQFFREGPIPEALKRRDFQEAALIGLLTNVEVRDRISVTTKEAEARLADLAKAALVETKQGEKPKTLPSRKAMIDLMRAERFRAGFRKLFRALFGKVEVRCPEYPALEGVDGVSPPRAEDGGGGKGA